MKKILRFLLLFVALVPMFWGIVFADTWDTDVIVTEKIPGMKCPEATLPNCTPADSPSCRRYKCTVKWWFWSVMDMLGGIIKYATFIVALIWVLMLVYSGIEMSMSGAFGDAKKAKERVTKIIVGMVLLFLIGFILNSIAPWIYQ